MSDFEAYLRSLKEGCTPSRTVDAMFYSLLAGESACARGCCLPRCADTACLSRRAIPAPQPSR